MSSQRTVLVSDAPACDVANHEPRERVSRDGAQCEKSWGVWSRFTRSTADGLRACGPHYRGIRSSRTGLGSPHQHGSCCRCPDPLHASRAGRSCFDRRHCRLEYPSRRSSVRLGCVLLADERSRVDAPDHALHGDFIGNPSGRDHGGRQCHISGVGRCPLLGRPIQLADLVDRHSGPAAIAALIAYRAFRKQGRVAIGEFGRASLYASGGPLSSIIMLRGPADSRRSRSHRRPGGLRLGSSAQRNLDQQCM